MPDDNKKSKIEDMDFSKFMRVPGGARDRFAAWNKMIIRDLNNTTGGYTPTFSRYTKDDINSYLQNPYQYEQQLRDAVVYIYGASPIFRRVIQYFVGLSDLAYVISPININPLKTKPASVERNYRKVMALMEAFSPKTQFPKILTVCLREDVFYGTIWATSDDVLVQQLPSNFCKISSIEGKCFNISFDFSFFDSRQALLEFYPVEFKSKYNAYLKDRVASRWQELDPPNSFAVKCNCDIVDYAIPPFVGILRELYDVEDYKNLKLTKTALENYAILTMTLGIDDEGNWQMDLDKAKEFWRNLDSIIPEEVGSILTPMPIEKIDFERSNTGDTNNVAEAEQSLFTAAGINSLLFNNDKASANALELSIKADQSITFGIVKGIQDVMNRYLQSQSFGKNFKVTFLDCSPFNRKELGDQYLKACQYGVPMVSYYCASQGLGQAELDCMNFLENDVLQIKKTFIPLQSSNTQTATGESEGATDEGGAPTKDTGEMDDKTEANREAE